MESVSPSYLYLAVIILVTLLIAYLFLKNFFQQFGKINALESQGITVTGEIAEVKNNVVKSGEISHDKLVVVHFNSSLGKSHFINYVQKMVAGDLITVGSPLDVTYLPSDPTIFKIPSKNISSPNKWMQLALGIIILLAGGGLAYFYYTNPSMFGMINQA